VSADTLSAHRFAQRHITYRPNLSVFGKLAGQDGDPPPICWAGFTNFYTPRNERNHEFVGVERPNSRHALTCHDHHWCPRDESGGQVLSSARACAGQRKSCAQKRMVRPIDHRACSIASDGVCPALTRRTSSVAAGSQTRPMSTAAPATCATQRAHDTVFCSKTSQAFAVPTDLMRCSIVSGGLIQFRTGWPDGDLHERC